MEIFIVQNDESIRIQASDDEVGWSVTINDKEPSWKQVAVSLRMLADKIDPHNYEEYMSALKAVLPEQG